MIVNADASLDVLPGLSAWIVPPPAAVRETRIEGVRPGPKGPVFKFEGVDSIDAASGLRDREILVRISDLPQDWAEPVEDEDVGLTVIDEKRGLLGQVVEVIVTGANDVWVVHGPLGEVLIPVIDDVVLAQDDESRVVNVRLLEGLLPEGDDR